MNFATFIRRHLPGTLALAAAALGLAMLLPRRAETQYSSPVRIMNTDQQSIPFRTLDSAQRFMMQCEVFLSQTPSSQVGSCPIAIPNNGKRAVLEMVGVVGEVQQGVTLYATANVNDGVSVLFDLDIPMHITYGDGGTHDFYRASQLVKLYADPGQKIYFNLYRGALGGGQDFAILYVSGYYADVP